MTAPLLAIAGLAVDHGRIRALHGVDLAIEAGEIVTLIGANGAGKTTLLRAISGVLRCTEGAIRYGGREIQDESTSERVATGIAQVPEGRQVFAPLTVEDNIMLGGYLRPRAECEPDREKLYAMFPILAQKRREPAGTLSGGQQQMLAIARALMSRPRLLLLDEPSMGLAPLLVSEIFATIRRLRETGTTVFLVEQNARAALSLADRGYVLETGRIVLSGSGKALLDDARVRSAYLGM
jgi:branched-chain amino acid transport system ATP-binding protein